MPTDVVKVNRSEPVMQKVAAIKLIEQVAGKDADGKTKDAFHRDLENFAADLAGPNPTATERVLAETAAMAWFALRIAEIKSVNATSTSGGLSIAQSEYYQRSIDRAERRLLRVVKTLAQVRKLAVPGVQVNVAGHQVNMVTSL